MEPVLYCSRKRALENDTPAHTKSTTKVASLKQNSFSEQSTYSGDPSKSAVQITDIQWRHAQGEINFKPKVVDTFSYINSNSHPVDKTVYFSWSTEEQQSTTWSQQWGTCENFEREVHLPSSACSLRISYNHMHNTSTTLAHLSSEKSLQVTMAPRKTVIAHLGLLVSENIKLPFIATVKFSDKNNTYREHKIAGLWSGSLYKLSSSNVRVYETELGIM